MIEIQGNHKILEITMDYLLEGVKSLFLTEGGWKNLIMFAIGIILIWLAIKKEYEPSLLLPIGFGAILVMYSSYSNHRIAAFLCLKTFLIQFLYPINQRI